MRNKTTISVIIFISILSSMTIFYYLYFADIITPQNISDLLINPSYIGPLIYFSMHIIRPFTFLPSSMLSIVAGISFNLWQGFAMCIAGFLMGASIPYFIGRRYGRKWLIGRYPKSKNIIDFVQSSAEESSLFIASLRLAPIFPSDLVSLVLGACQISYPKYMLGTLFGSLLGLSMFYYTGIQIRERSYLQLFSIVISFALLTLIFYKKKNSYINKLNSE